jgi:steroid delta-isomerase-like uncharacterized protein
VIRIRQPEEIKAMSPEQSPERNKAIVRGYLNDIVNDGNLAAFDRYFSADVVFNNATAFRQQLAGMIQTSRSAFPDRRVTIEDQIAEGDWVMTRVTFHGTHQGEFRGVAATGKQVNYFGIAVDRIADGKVVEMWHLTDMSGLLREIGATLPPASQK